MANNNRTEVAAFIEALAAVVDLEELKEVLNDQFAQSVLFRKDVASTDSTVASSKTLDFLNIDYLAVTQDAVFTVYTLDNVQQGEIKYLKIIKTGGQTLSFLAPTIDTTPDLNYTDAETEVLYEVTNKDGTNIFVSPISRGIAAATETIKGIVEKSTVAERNAGTAEKFIDAELLIANTGGLLKTVLEIGDWNMDTLATATVTHGLTVTKIRSVSVMIRDDADANHYNLIGGFSVGAAITESGTINAVTTTDVTLGRVTSGFFDGVDFDATTYNRGWVIIESIP